MLHFISVLRSREGSWSAVINQFGAASRGRQRSTGDSVHQKIVNDYGLAVPKKCHPHNWGCKKGGRLRSKDKGKEDRVTGGEKRGLNFFWSDIIVFCQRQSRINSHCENLPKVSIWKLRNSCLDRHQMMLYSRRCAVLQCAAIFMRFLFKSGMSQNADDPHTFRKQYLASTSEDLHANEQTCEPCLTMLHDIGEGTY